jgi:predicted RNase H-like HicB family nuclease
MRVEIDHEEDGRWIAEVPDLPGAMVYGNTREEAIARVEALALRILADRLEHGEEIPEMREVFAVLP